MPKTKENLDADKILRLKKVVADAINRLEVPTLGVKLACERNGWNDEIVYTIYDAVRNLGQALATLETWFDDLMPTSGNPR